MEDLIFADKGYKTIQDGEMTIYYSNYYPMYGIENCGDFLFIYKNKALTNINFTENTNTVEKIKAQVLEKNKSNFCYENNQYSTNIDGFVDSYIENYLNSINGISYYTRTSDNTVSRYHYGLSSYEESSVDYYNDNVTESTETILTPEIAETPETPDIIQYHTAKLEDFTFYTSFNPELPEDSEIRLVISFMETLKPYEKQVIIAMPICAILTLIIFIYLINSIGHVKGKEEVELTDFDNIPLDIIFIIFSIIFAMACAIIVEGLPELRMSIDSFITLIVTIYIVIAILVETFIVTTTVRIKAKKLLDTTICGKLFKLCVKILQKIIEKIIKIWKLFVEKCKKVTSNLNRNIGLTSKVIVAVILYMIVNLVLIGIFGFLGFIIDVFLLWYAIYEIIVRVNSFSKLEAGLKEIYEGNNKTRLYKDDFSKEFGNCIDYINDISNGIEKAVEENLKSERLKTELITNVSHDIKTPLTSIINYVDLIKKENIDNEKIKEYVEILDGKSQRLKKLTEDLVEASKASSGNVSLNLEEIGLVELLNQLIGEYKDKFEEKNLEVISNLSKVNVKIKADSRYLYRVIDNLFGNIAKYALDGSRVYIETKIVDDGKIKTILKNISKDKLNISEEELMQRFVRGDKSRTTEGSGLGLAIAKSLTELQKGSLECKIDGDLFKVEIVFDII